MPGNNRRQKLEYISIVSYLFFFHKFLSWFYIWLSLDELTFDSVRFRRVQFEPPCFPVFLVEKVLVIKWNHIQNIKVDTGRGGQKECGVSVIYRFVLLVSNCSKSTRRNRCWTRKKRNPYFRNILTWKFGEIYQMLDSTLFSLRIDRRFFENCALREDSKI